jgi:hypothetical protein
MQRRLELSVVVLLWATGCGAPVVMDPADAAVDVPVSDAGADDPGVDAGAPDAGALDAGPTPSAAPAVDAVFNMGNGKLFFFKGDEYLRYDLATDMADTATPSYPRNTAAWWPGLWDAGVDAVSELGDGRLVFFNGPDFAQYDIARDAVDPGFPRPIAARWPALGDGGVDAALLVTGNDGGRELQLFQGASVARFTPDSGEALGMPPASALWPGLDPQPVDAVVEVGTNVYFFQGDTYRRYDAATRTAAPGYPLETKWYWPGLWDPQDGTGHPGQRLPADIAQRLVERPSAAEITARRQRVAASASTGEVDLSAQYPLFIASVEDRLKSWGCGIFQSTTAGSYRFRCATNTSGAERLDLPRLTVPYIDWSRGAYHVDQVSQGDFMADFGTPMSIFRTDDGVFFIDAITPNPATGSISAGLNIRVRFRSGGVTHFIGYSHLNTRVPGYVLDAARDGTSLPTGTVFGFIGYTGNLWIDTPPAMDAPYSGTGAGLPQSHSHLWFKDSLDDHLKLSVPTRKAIDFTRSYPWGGG